MLRKILDITWLHIKTTYQERSTLIFGFLMPVAFTFVIGVGISGFDPGDDSPQTWNLNVVNQDAGELSTLLINRLSGDPILEVAEVDAAIASAELEEGVSSRPAGFLFERDDPQPESQRRSSGPWGAVYFYAHWGAAGAVGRAHDRRYRRRSRLRNHARDAGEARRARYQSVHGDPILEFQKTQLNRIEVSAMNAQIADQRP